MTVPYVGAIVVLRSPVGPRPAIVTEVHSMTRVTVTEFSHGGSNFRGLVDHESVTGHPDTGWYWPVVPSECCCCCKRRDHAQT